MFEGVHYSHLLDHLAEAYQGKEAIVCGGRRLSFDDLRDRSNRVGSALRRKGIGRGNVILTALGNDPDFIAIFFAAMKLGAVLVPCDTALDAEALKARAQDVSADIALMGELRQIADAQSLAKLVPLALVNVEDDRYPDVFGEEGGDLADIGTDIDGVASADEVRLIAFTSGSTGSPKGALLSEDNLFKPASSLVQRFRLSDSDVVLMPLPISHMFGLVSGMLMSLLAGAKLVLMEKFEPYSALELIERERVTVHHAVPTMLFRELAVVEAGCEVYDTSTLRTGMLAGASVPETLIRRAQQGMGCEFVSAYGSTETVNVTCGFPEDPVEKRARYVGKPSDGVKLRIVDGEGFEAARGDVGELLVKGPGVMKGYLNVSDGGSSIDESGWFHTGDVASISDDGYVSLCGRKKDLIIRAGNNIVPAAVEAAFGEHPDVVEACVIGAPDDDLGEKAVLFVSLVEGVGLREDSLRAFVRPKIPRFAMPDAIVKVASMPRLANGKIDKRALVSMHGETFA